MKAAASAHEVAAIEPELKGEGEAAYLGGHRSKLAIATQVPELSKPAAAEWVAPASTKIGSGWTEPD